MSSFTYNSTNITHLEVILSSDRFETYILLAGGSKRKALKLYKRNILLSHRFYTIIHILEVCLRNKIDECLSKRYGLKWFENSKLELSLVQKKQLAELPKSEKRGKVIASLPFGFWSSFFGRPFENLWRETIRFILNEEIPIRRSNVAAYLKNIRALRNRIAHHECILKMDAHRLETSSLELLSLLSPITTEWLKLELLNSSISL